MGLRSRFKTKKQLTGPCTYRKWEDWKDGEFVIGKYTGIKTSDYGDNYKIELLETNIPKQAVNTTLVLNSNGLLDKAMTEVQEGDIIQVTYRGKQTLTKGKFAGKEAHNVEVAVLEEDEEVDL